MDKSLFPKILEEIEKSGFPLELEIVEKLRLENILTFSNISFQDNNNNIHEIDVVATIMDEESEWTHGPCGIRTVIECKKTDKYPWVFFEEVYNPLHNLGLVYKLDYSTDLFGGSNFLNPLVGCMNTSLASHWFNDHDIPIARTYFEAFKKPNEPTAIYKAVTNIYHSRKYLNEWFVKSRKDNVKPGRTLINQYAIVINGPLVLATKNEASFQLREVNHLLLCCTDTQSNSSNMFIGDEIVIDVISFEYFSEYLEKLKKSSKDFNLHLKRIDGTLVKVSKEMQPASANHNTGKGK